MLNPNHGTAKEFPVMQCFCNKNRKTRESLIFICLHLSGSYQEPRPGASLGKPAGRGRVDGASLCQPLEQEPGIGLATCPGPFLRVTHEPVRLNLVLF